MSSTITEARVQQYKANIMELAQQRGSRLRMSVTDEGDIIGKRVYFDRIGATAAQRVTTRHGDTPLMNTPHSRRSAPMLDYDWADLVDKADKLKTITDPTNKYAIAGSNALGRAQDDEIITALGGSAEEGEEATSSIALPAAQKIVVNASGFTLVKLIDAKELLDAAEVDEHIERYIVWSSAQQTDLLNDATVTSGDYATVKALVDGKINSYMGFTFLRSERLAVDGSSDRLCYAYAKTGIGLGVPQDINVSIDKRPDKRNAMQVYACQSLGAVRVEDVQVVQIACSE